MSNNYHQACTLAGILALSLGLVLSSVQAGDPVNIKEGLFSVTVKHHGREVAIQREQDNFAVVNPDFAKTSRPCPPFCIQPMQLAPGVETIAELEMLDYLVQASQPAARVLVIDSRTSNWVRKGTIPGSKNIPWIRLNPKKGATTESIIELLQTEFAAKLAAGEDAFSVDEAIVAGDPSRVFDYSHAKTLILFCNGMWCGQSPQNIKYLLKFGYPAEKIKWYRGGMQNWSNLGLTTIRD